MTSGSDGRSSNALMDRLEAALRLLGDIGNGPSPDEISEWAETDGYPLLLDLKAEIEALNQLIGETPVPSTRDVREAIDRAGG